MSNAPKFNQNSKNVNDDFPILDYLDYVDAETRKRVDVIIAELEKSDDPKKRVEEKFNYISKLLTHVNDVRMGFHTALHKCLSIKDAFVSYRMSIVKSPGFDPRDMHTTSWNAPEQADAVKILYHRLFAQQRMLSPKVKKEIESMKPILQLTSDHVFALLEMKGMEKQRDRFLQLFNLAHNLKRIIHNILTEIEEKSKKFLPHIADDDTKKKADDLYESLKDLNGEEFQTRINDMLSNLKEKALSPNELYEGISQKLNTNKKQLEAYTELLDQGMVLICMLDKAVGFDKSYLSASECTLAFYEKVERSKELVNYYERHLDELERSKKLDDCYKMCLKKIEGIPSAPKDKLKAWVRKKFSCGSKGF